MHTKWSFKWLKKFGASEKFSFPAMFSTKWIIQVQSQCIWVMKHTLCSISLFFSFTQGFSLKILFGFYSSLFFPLSPVNVSQFLASFSALWCFPLWCLILFLFSFVWSFWIHRQSSYIKKIHIKHGFKRKELKILLFPLNLLLNWLQSTRVKV